MTKLDDKMIKNICAEYKLHNCLVNFSGDYDVDELIDCIEGNWVYIKCLYVYNKIDICSIEDIEYLAREPNTCFVSMSMWLGLDNLLDKIWEMLDIVWVYTKKKGLQPDLSDPLILSNTRHGKTV